MAVPATERFQAAARELGLETKIKTFPEDTRTAQQAADALGCELGQIVKSLIFTAGDEHVLVLTSGVNRVDVAKAASLLGVDALGKADAQGARTATGFAIGGIPPCGHPTPLRSVVDEDLLTWDTVWAAAGAPDAVFELTPAKLLEVTGASPGQVAERKES